MTRAGAPSNFALPETLILVCKYRNFPMLRQLLQALRLSIADFFDVPWPAVAAMLAMIVLLCAYAYLRTNYFALSYGVPGKLLWLGVFIALGVAGNYLRRR